MNKETNLCHSEGPPEESLRPSTEGGEGDCEGEGDCDYETHSPYAIQGTPPLANNPHRPIAIAIAIPIAIVIDLVGCEGD